LEGTVRSSFPPTVLYNPKAFITHAALLHQAFAHCGKFLTAASRRSLGRVSVPVWLIVLSDQLPIFALVGRYPTNKLIGREPVIERLSPFFTARCLTVTASGINPDFSGLSRNSKVGCSRVTHPCAARHRSAALDLHVSCTPPALILSQDQTLQRNTRITDRTNPVGSHRVDEVSTPGSAPKHRSPWPLRKVVSTLQMSRCRRSREPRARALSTRRRNFGIVPDGGGPVKAGDPGRQRTTEYSATPGFRCPRVRGFPCRRARRTSPQSARRPANALATVTSSAYWTFEPAGRPWASRVTTTPEAASRSPT
jgi:hypothetical protein